jgi:hypothetical protein
MPVDPNLAGLHFQVQLAGQEAEQAAASLRLRRIFPGRLHLQNVARHLADAAVYLTASGQFPTVLAYVKGTLIPFYSAQAQQVLRPQLAPKIADAISSNQGNLLSTDVLLVGAPPPAPA